MFDLDIGKMVLVAVVALVVVGPKELPQVLRALGQAMSRLRGLQSKVREVMADFVAEADLDGIGKDLASVEKDMRTAIARNPATAMRGTLPTPSRAVAVAGPSQPEAPRYASPEMEAYLSPPAEPPPEPRAVPIVVA